MLSIENKIINDIKAALTGVRVVSDYSPTETVFPCVSVSEDNNTVLAKTYYEGEHHSVSMVAINIYTNDSQKKLTAKNLVNSIDSVMSGLKYTRITANEVPNIDRTIYRFTLRYEAIIGEPTVDANGNLNYQIYRR